MTMLEEIRARHKLSTPGPWRWRGNTSSYDVHLRSIVRPLNVVLDYIRWGMQGTIPVFRNDRNVLQPAKLIPSAPHNAWDIVAIDHPDAVALERSWEDREWLLGHIDAIHKEFDEACALLSDEEHQWMGMDKAQRENMRTLIDWALEGRPQQR